MSMLEQLEANLEAAIAQQQAGRVTREQAVKAIAEAIGGAPFPSKSSLNKASATLDAAIASGYVVRPK